MNGRSLIGCNQGNCYPQEFIPKLIQAWEEGNFPFDRLIKTYSARDMEQAVHDIHNGSTIKAVLIWD